MRLREDIWRSRYGLLGLARWLVLDRLGLRKTVPVVIRGNRLHLRTGTPDMGVALKCLLGEFDAVVKALPVLRHNLVIDAGGYIGAAAIYFATAYPEAIVVTVEPSPENFAILARNVAPYPNIVAINRALAPERGSVDLMDRGTGPWGFTAVAGDDELPVIGRVECVTIPDILDKVDRSGIDVLKIDIEGGEYALFNGDTSWMAATGAICIELHDRIVDGCSDLFEEVTDGRLNCKLEGEKHLSLLDV